MINKYLQVFISAENSEQASKIRDALMLKKIIPGGPILQGPAKFWWKEEMVEMDYCYIFSYTTADRKDELISEVKLNSVEEVPMVTFTTFEANQELLDWIDKTLSNKF
jgi:uncharacterized protein involved in tolerance to divalent cations